METRGHACLQFEEGMRQREGCSFDILTLRLAHSSTQACAMKLSLARKTVLSDRGLDDLSQPILLGKSTDVEKP